MSLTSAYAKAWQKQYGLAPGWFVNTQPNDHIALGTKGRLLGDAFQQSGPLAQLDALLPPPSSDPSGRSAWQFQSSSDTHFESAIAGKTSGNIDWLAGAQAGLKVSFGHESGVLAFGTHKWFSRFGDMDAVRDALRQAVSDGNLVEGDAVVVELQLTGKGVMLVSQNGESSVEATAQGSVAPAGVDIADFSGSFAITRQQGAATMEQFDDSSVIAARVMYVGHRGMWWWRRLAVFGVEPMSVQQQEASVLTPVEGDGPDEYFLLF